MSDRENPGQNYFPLSVEFEEKFYAAGKILGSRFMRREGRASDAAILSARIIDRTIRPLFNQSIRKDVQVVVNVLAVGEEDPDVLGIIGASLALSVSDIPWRGPIGAVRIGRAVETHEIITNPTYPQREVGLLDFQLLACGKDGTLNMIETAAYEINENAIVSALEAAAPIHRQLEDWQKEIVVILGKIKMIEENLLVPTALELLFTNSFQEKLSQTLFSCTPGKAHISALKTEFLLAVTESKLPAETASHYFKIKLIRSYIAEHLKKVNGQTVEGWMRYVNSTLKQEECLPLCMVQVFFIVVEHIFFLPLLWVDPSQHNLSIR
jgi:polyribonucleotide nucleotidyltransferase